MNSYILFYVNGHFLGPMYILASSEGQLGYNGSNADHNILK